MALGLALVGGLGLFGCRPTQPGATSTVPLAEAYDEACNFAGQWLGEVEGEVGTLEISPLGEGRYRGLYKGETIEVEYVLLLEQDRVAAGETELLGNRARFTWQDGRGSRGEGWLLINREDSALTGAHGQRGMMDRAWTFIRVE